MCQKSVFQSVLYRFSTFRNIKILVEREIKMRNSYWRLLLCACIFIWCSAAQSFQLSPIGTAAERREAKRWGMTIRAEIYVAENALHNFSDPAHEALTQLIFGCDGDWVDCEDPDLEWAGPYVIAGVRWNDDPVFQLMSGEARGLPCAVGDTISFVTQTRCWIALFRDAEKKSASDPTYFLKSGKGNYLSRSHFGDLQFLHSMASTDGESPVETKEKILMWAEFTWNVAQGKHNLNTNLKSISIPLWENHFANGQNVQDLFTLGRPWLRAHIRDVAFGSLLHLVQDSFAEGHVQRREPVTGQSCANSSSPAFGAIVEFHSYVKQDHEKHKDADSSESAQKHRRLIRPDVIEAGQTLRTLMGQTDSWASAREYLSDCVFRLDERVAPASAGDAFSME
jgi:hypothetical protein